MDTWFKMFSPIMDLRLPASGDVSMDYRPRTNWGRISSTAGNPEIEFEVFRDVALPGMQLGRLIDAVVELIELAESSQTDEASAERDKEKAKVFQDLKQLAAEIETKKDALKLAAKADARKALERFARTNEDYWSSVQQMHREIDEERKPT